jgi:hypothetical protein
MIEGLAGAKHFMDLDRATAHAERHLIERVRTIARASGTDEDCVDMNAEDEIVPIGNGSRMFLCRTITAQLVGQPDRVLVQTEAVKEMNITSYSRKGGIHG